jgi:hypothetical protein
VVALRQRGAAAMLEHVAVGHHHTIEVPPRGLIPLSAPICQKAYLSGLAQTPLTLPISLSFPHSGRLRHLLTDQGNLLILKTLLI